MHPYLNYSIEVFFKCNLSILKKIQTCLDSTREKLVMKAVHVYIIHLGQRFPNGYHLYGGKNFCNHGLTRNRNLGKGLIISTIVRKKTLFQFIFTFNPWIHTIKIKKVSRLCQRHSPTKEKKIRKQSNLIDTLFWLFHEYM